MSPGMAASNAPEENLPTNLHGQEGSDPDSSKQTKEPATPELQQQAQEPNRSRFGLPPTPDTTPKHRRVAPGGPDRQAFVHLPAPREAGLETPAPSSRAPSSEGEIEDRDRRSQQSNHSSEPSERPSSSRPPTPASYLVEEDCRPSSSSLPLSVVKSIYDSVLSLLNLAKQPNSRADAARVRGTINLIKSLPTIKRTRVGNVTRKLTAKQFAELLKIVEDEEDDEFRSYFQDKLRFDYSRHKQRLEIRMPTSMHEEVGDYIMGKFSLWKHALESSADVRVSDAAKTVKPSGSTDVQFSYARGANDSKSPDKSIRHKKCDRKCRNPTILMEFAWTQVSDNLEDKAKAYICRSQGEIRTVVAIDMRRMYLAEKRNENRLFEMYLAGEVDKNGRYSYPDDGRNETADASFMVWRARTTRRGRVSAVCVQNESFRDKAGDTIESALLCLPLQDFICKDIVDSPAGAFEAPPLEISAEGLNECIRDTLMYYRQERNEINKKKAEEELEKRRLEATAAAAAAQKKKMKTTRKVKEPSPQEAADRTAKGHGILGRIKRDNRWISARSM